MINIKSGSVVRLKSGGPLMTISRVWQKPCNDTMAYCQWFTQELLQGDNFPVEVLEVHNEQTD